MAKHAKVDTSDRPDLLYPLVPKGDSLDAASAVLDDVLDRISSLQDDLLAVATQHVDAAPASSVHVLDLTAAIARTVLGWIERWPA